MEYQQLPASGIAGVGNYMSDQHKHTEEKLMLHATSKIVIEVNYFDLGEFVKECYKLDERWLCSEVNNSSYYLFDINPSPEDDSEFFAAYDLEEALEVIENGEGDYYGDIGSALARLCYDKFIPPGNYLVHVSW